MEYSEENVQEFIWAQHIRKRPAMYIGNLNQTGFNQLLEYFLVDLLSCGPQNIIIEVQFLPDNSFAIEVKNINTRYLLDILENIEVKYTEAFGIRVLLALSTETYIKIIKHPTVVIYWGGKGNYNSAASTAQQKENNALINFTLDPTIFNSFQVSYNYTNTFLKQFTMLNPGLKIISTDKTTNELQQRVFYFPEGVFHQLDSILALEPHQPDVFTLLKIQETINGYSYRIGLCYSHLYTQVFNIKSYAGNNHTYENGSLVDGILDGIKMAVKELAGKEKATVSISKKRLLDGLTIIASVTGKEYNWYGSTKHKLYMLEVRKTVKQLVSDRLTAYYSLNPHLQDNIINRFRVWPENEDL